MLVATSNNAPEQLDALLGWLGQDVQRWSSLDGTALIGAPGHEPVLVFTGQSAPATSAVPESRPTVLLGIGAVLVALLGVAAGIVIYRRARRSKGKL